MSSEPRCSKVASILYLWSDGTGDVGKTLLIIGGSDAASCDCHRGHLVFIERLLHTGPRNALEGQNPAVLLNCSFRER